MCILCVFCFVLVIYNEEVGSTGKLIDIQNWSKKNNIPALDWHHYLQGCNMGICIGNGKSGHPVIGLYQNDYLYESFYNFLSVNVGYVSTYWKSLLNHTLYVLHLCPFLIYVSSQNIFPACVCLTPSNSQTREGPSSGSDGLRCSPWEKQMSSLILKITFKVLLLPGDANHWPGWDRKQSAFKLKPCNFSSNHQRSYQTHAAFMPAASGIFEWWCNSSNPISLLK